jgi:hypothetical protein
MDTFDNLDKNYYSGDNTYEIDLTAFGFYDDDEEFKSDGEKLIKYCASRLGYPVMGVELGKTNFFTAFESAITTYGNEVYSFKTRDNQLDLEGTSLDIFKDENGNNTYLNDRNYTPNQNSVISISKQYGSESGSGGFVDWRRFEVPLNYNQQTYDVQSLINVEDQNTRSIEIKRVYYQQSPAITRLLDPYSGSGFGFQGMISNLGGGVAIPGVSYLMRPVSLDLMSLNLTEISRQVRGPSFTFRLINNKLQIFPIPTIQGSSMFIEYIYTDERSSSSISGNNVVSNISNSPFKNPEYNRINSIGRRWIFEYTLALCKEMLGYVRGKFSSIPIPGDEVNMNYGDLISSSKDSQDKLLEDLRKQLEETSRKGQLERKSQESEFRNNEMRNIPLSIYIG